MLGQEQGCLIVQQAHGRLLVVPVQANVIKDTGITHLEVQQLTFSTTRTRRDAERIGFF